MSDQLIRAESLTRLQRYTSHHDFAPLRIRYSEDRRFTNSRMLVNNRFDLTGVNVFAARDNHVFQAVQDVKIPFFILIADVASSKVHPTILDNCRKTIAVGSCIRNFAGRMRDVRVVGVRQELNRAGTGMIPSSRAKTRIKLLTVTKRFMMISFLLIQNFGPHTSVTEPPRPSKIVV